LADILSLKIKDVITSRPTRIRHDSEVHRAAEIVGMSRVSDLMVAKLATYTDLLEIEDLRFMSDLKHTL
jgi:hypothetical protein